MPASAMRVSRAPPVAPPESPELSTTPVDEDEDCVARGGGLLGAFVPPPAGAGCVCVIGGGGGGGSWGGAPVSIASAGAEASATANPAARPVAPGDNLEEPLRPRISMVGACTTPGGDRKSRAARRALR